VKQLEAYLSAVAFTACIQDSVRLSRTVIDLWRGLSHGPSPPCLEKSGTYYLSSALIPFRVSLRLRFRHGKAPECGVSVSGTTLFSKDEDIRLDNASNSCLVLSAWVSWVVDNRKWQDGSQTSGWCIPALQTFCLALISLHTPWYFVQNPYSYAKDGSLPG
jgi:hypothetical protein